MAYLTFIANGEEYDRRDLRAPMLLGRAPDCDLSIPDITLSRHHCRVELAENGRCWQLVDLHSKNGTQFRGQNIECHVLRDGDELRIGRTRVTFRAGKFVKGSSAASPKAVLRAVDPHEALSGTVTGLVVCEPGEGQKHQGMPVPRPRPVDPAAYQKDDIYGMINELASSSFDSTQAQNSKPVRMQRAAPVPGVTQAESARTRPRVSIELQADHPDSTPSKKRQSAPTAPAAKTRVALLEPHPAPRRSALLLAATSAVAAAAILFVAAWATVSLSRGHTDVPNPAMTSDLPAALPRPQNAPDPLAITARAVDPMPRADRAVPASVRLPSTPIGAPTTSPVRIPFIATPDPTPHLTAFDFDLLTPRLHRPRPTDIAPDDLFRRPIPESEIQNPKSDLESPLNPKP